MKKVILTLLVAGILLGALFMFQPEKADASLVDLSTLSWYAYVKMPNGVMQEGAAQILRWDDTGNSVMFTFQGSTYVTSLSNVVFKRAY